MNRESAWFNKNTRRFMAGGLAIFVIFQICDFIINGFLLGNFYTSVSNVMRPDFISFRWITYIGNFIFSFLMMYVFIKGFEDRGVLEGVRFGLMIGTMTIGMSAVFQYSVYPVPFSFVIQWFGYNLFRFIFAGIAAGAIYKPRPEDETGEAEDDLEIV